MAKSILGIFSKRDQAEDALYELETAGYNPKDISILMKDMEESRKLAQDTRATVAESTVTGATTGGVIGALTGLLVATGVIPGLGVLLIGGPLATALGLTGAAATTASGALTGALAGGLLGVLTGFGLSKDEAEVYEERIREGGILVAVPASTHRVDEVIDILEDCGADQIRAIDQTAMDRETTDYPERDTETTYTRPDYFQDPSSYNQVGTKGGKVDESPRRRTRRVSRKRA